MRLGLNFVGGLGSLLSLFFGILLVVVWITPTTTVVAAQNEQIAVDKIRRSDDDRGGTIKGGQTTSLKTNKQQRILKHEKTFLPSQAPSSANTVIETNAPQPAVSSLVPVSIPNNTPNDSTTTTTTTTPPIPLLPPIFIPTTSNNNPSIPINPSSTAVEQRDITLANLQELVEAFAPQGGIDVTAFSNLNSYQSRALLRTFDQDNVENMDYKDILQHWVLFCLYLSTNGDGENDDILIRGNKDNRMAMPSPGWKHADGWNERHRRPCDAGAENDKGDGGSGGGWYGITCDRLGRVTDIQLSRNNLQGAVPPELALLAYDGSRATGVGDLYRLDLSHNPYLTNDHDNTVVVSDNVDQDDDHESDSSWMAYLGSHLQILNYGSTQFRGRIPPRLPPNIVEYDCSYTDYIGPIPESTFTNAPYLELLVLDGNRYESSVPTSLSQLSRLKYLYIRNASLIGDLSYLDGMSSLIEHMVDNNPQLTGSIPTVLGQLVTLQSFSATDCGLSGTLPTELASLTDMVQIWLYGNHRLMGTIPSSYGTNLRQLRILALEDTSINGIVPFELCLEQEFHTHTSTLSTDCNDKVDCDVFFPDCCKCCGRQSCGT